MISIFVSSCRLLFIVVVLFIAIRTSAIENDIPANTPVAIFPLQFSANIEITAHLIEPDSEYPPRTRRMTVYYDYESKQARADMEGGYEAAKVYLRRYDEKYEYMIRLPPINDCKRSYLGEVMPYPDIPDASFVKMEVVNGILCNYFVHKDFDTIIHIFMSDDDGSPVKLIQESIEDGISTPLLTYDYSDVHLGPVESHWFDIPKPFQHKSCVRHVGGFPYLHIFHYFVKF